MGASVVGLTVVLSMAVAMSPSGLAHRLTSSPGPLTPYTAFELMISSEGGDLRQRGCATGTLGPYAAALHHTSRAPGCAVIYTGSQQSCKRDCGRVPGRQVKSVP